MLLGYDLNGHCPMFIDNKCSIYEHKPLTCSNYDCRIFTAIGISEEERKTKIIQQSPHWKFSYPAKRDREQHIAVQAAAKFIRERAECFPAGLVPVNTSQLAITAIKVYDVFLKINKEFNKTGRVSSDMETARAIMEANEKFETSRRCEKK
jgi:Fe-S-cluster containining protein